VLREQFNSLTPLAILTGFVAGVAADEFYNKLQEVKLSTDIPTK
jgi:hypothetical protein